MTFISRDPFAREELHRGSIDAMGDTCSWCGSVRNGKKLYIYRTERDSLGARRSIHNGAFCSKDCHDIFHGRK